MTGGSPETSTAPDLQATAAAIFFAVDGRAATAPELAAAVQSLSGDPSDQALKTQLAQSAEAKNVAILRALYEGLLGRAAEAAGLEGWAAAMAGGLPPVSAADGILASAEFIGKNGILGDGAFVALLYQGFLGRIGSASETAGWLAALGSGRLTRAGMAVAFAQSAEASGQNSWLGLKVSADMSAAMGQGEIAAQADLAALSSPPTTVELADGLEKLTGGSDAAGLAGALVQSSFALFNADLIKLYHGLLGRVGDAGGLQAWRAALEGGLSLKAAAQAFLQAPEYQALYPGQGNDAFVQLLYQGFLNRAPDQPGRAAWLQALDTGTISRADAVVVFINTVEPRATPGQPGQTGGSGGTVTQPGGSGGTVTQPGGSGGGGPSQPVPILVAPPVDYPSPVATTPLPPLSVSAGSAFSVTLSKSLFQDFVPGDVPRLTAGTQNGTLPSWLSFDPGSGTLSGLPGDDSTGPLDIVVTATDGDGNKGATTLHLSVAGVYDVPSVSVSGLPLTLSAWSDWSYSLSPGLFNEDIRGDTLTYSASWQGLALPSWLSFDAGDQTFTAAAKNAQTGLLDVVVTAADQIGLSAATTLHLSVAPTYHLPSVSTTGIPLALSAGTAWSYSLPPGLFTEDVDNDPLTFAASWQGSALPSWLSFDTATQSFSAQPTDAATGPFDIQLTATDRGHNSAGATLHLSVAGVYQAPLVTSPLPAMTLSAGPAWSLSLPPGLFSEAITGDSLVLSASGQGSALPSWLSFDPTSQTLRGAATDTDTGLLNVVLTATDMGGLSAATTLSLSVAPTFGAPVLTEPLPAQTASAGTEWSFTLPDGLFNPVVAGDTVGYSATLTFGSLLPAWITFDPSSRAFRADPSENEVGQDSLVVWATDGGGYSTGATLQLSVAPVYHVPSVSATGIPLTLSAWSKWNYSLSPGLFTEDIYGDSLTYSAVWQGSALPSWLSFNRGTQTFTALAKNAQTGLLDVVVTAADMGGLSAATTVHLSVAPTYHLPSVGSPPPTMTLSAGTAWRYSLSSKLFTEDVDLDPLTLAASWQGSALPSWLSFNAATQSFSALPTDAATGPFDIQVTATDLGHNSASTTLHLSVAGVYHAPSVSTTGIPLTLSAWSDWSYSLPPGLFSETVSVDTLTYLAAWQGSALPSWLSFSPGTLSFTAMARNAQTGLLDVVVTAADQIGLSTATTLHLSVAPTYHLPSVSTTGIPLALSAGTAWSYSLPPGLFTEDVDNDPLTLAASRQGSALPSWLSFNAATQSFSAQPTDAATGPFDIQLTATDLGHNSAGTTLHLSVAGVYQAPTVSTTAIPLTLSAWSNWSYSLPPGLFSGTVTGDTLTYSAGWLGSALPSWLSFNAATRTFTAMAKNAQTGLLDVVVTATEHNGLSAATTLHLSVAPTYHIPSVSTTGIPLTLSAGAAWHYSLSSGLFTEDVDLDPLTLAASWQGSALPSWLSFNAATQSFSALATDAATGPFDIQVTATDLGHNSASTTLHLSVAGVYQAPSVSTTAIPLTLSAWSNWSYSLPPGLFSETVSVDTLTYSAAWQGSALPSWLGFNAATRTFTAMARNAQTGLLDVVVTAADQIGLSATTTLHLSVAPTYHIPSVSTTGIPLTLAAGTAWSYSLPPGLFTEDVDNDPLTLAASWQGSALPSWLSFNAATQSFSAQPTDAATGPFDIRLTATDLGHNSAGTTLHLSVAGVYQAPSVSTTGIPLTLSAWSNWRYSLPPGLFSGTVTGDRLTYSAGLRGSALPSWLSFDAGNQTFTAAAKNAQTGLLDVVVTAADQIGLSTTTTLHLSVAPTYHPPSVSTTGIPLTLAAGTAWSYSLPPGLFTEDVDLDPLTLAASWQGSALPSWLSFNAATQSFSAQPTDAATGPFDIQVTATDLGHNSAGTTLHLSVAGVYQAPSVTSSLPAMTLSAGPAWTYSLPPGLFSEAITGDSLVFSASGQGSALAGWLSFDPTTQTLRGAATDTDTGLLNVVLTAADMGGLSAATTLHLSVAPTFGAPVLAEPLPAQTASAGTEWSFTLPDGLFNPVVAGDTVSYSATMTFGSLLPAWISFDPSSRTFRADPSLNEVGQDSLVVWATDGGGYSTGATLQLSVAPVYHVPTVSATGIPLTLSAWSNWSYSLPPGLFSGTVIGDTLTYSASWQGSALPTWLGFDAGDQTFTALAKNAQTGLLDVVVTAADQIGLSAATTLHLSVAPTYHIPSVSTTGIPLTLSVGTAWRYSLPPGLFSEDVDLDPLTLAASWQGSALPGWLMFNAATQSFSALPTDAATGPFDIQVTATDLGHNSASTTLHLSVAGLYRAPSVSTTGIPLTLSAWSNWSYSLPPGLFSGTVTGDTLTYSAGWQGSALPSWLSFNPGTRSFTAMARNAQTGLLDVVVTATEQIGLSAATTLHLSVAPTYHIPSVSTTGIPLTLSAGTAWSYSLPPGLFTEDVDNDPLTLAASRQGAALPSWLSFDAATQSFSAQPTDAATGPFDIRVTATDLGHNSARTTLHLSVAGVYQAPSVSTTGIPLTLSAWSNWSYSLPPGLFSGTVTGDALTYSAGWQGSALPSWLSFNSATQTFTAMARNAQTGLLDVVVTAAEQIGLSAATTLHLSVAPTYHIPSVSTTGVPLTLSAGTAWSYSLPPGLFTEDVDLDPLTLAASWQGSALPGWLSFDPTTQTLRGAATDTDTGLLNVVLTAADMGGLSAATTLHLSVAPTFGPPVLTEPLPEQTASVGTEWSFTLPDGLFDPAVAGDTVSYSATMTFGSLLPAWISFDPSSRTFRASPSQMNEVGQDSLVVWATDGGGYSTGATLQLSVAPGYHVPTVSATYIPLTLSAWNNWSYSLPPGLFTEDIQGDTLTYSASWQGSALPSWLSFDAENQTFTAMARNTQTGLLDVVVTAADMGGLSAATTLHLSVAPTYAPPSVTKELPVLPFLAGTKINFNLPADLFSEVIPDDSLVLSASWHGSALPGWLSFDPATGGIFAQPTDAATGPFDILLTATDLGHNSAGTTLHLSVAGVYQAPSVSTTGIPLTLSAWSNWSYSLPPGLFSGTITGDTLTYSAGWEGSALPSWLSFDAGDQTFTALARNAQTGLLDVVVTAADQVGLATTTTLHLSVAPTYHPPSVSTTGIPLALSAGTAWSYSLPPGLFTEDVDLDPLTLAASWHGSALPSWLSFNAATQSFSAQPTDAATGPFDILLTATDLGHNSVSTTLHLSVAGVYRAPTVSTTGIPLTLSAWSSWSYSLPPGLFSGTVAGDTLTYSAGWQGSALPSWLSFNPGTQTFAAMATNSQTGLLDVVVAATEDIGLSAATTLHLSVAPTYDPPSVTSPLPILTVTAAPAWSYSLPAGLFSEAITDDPLAYSASYQGSALPVWLTFNPQSRIFSGAPTDAATGPFDILLTATDLGHNSASTTLHLVVEPAWDTPSVSTTGIPLTLSAWSNWSYSLPAGLFSENIPGDSLHLFVSDSLPWLSYNAEIEAFTAGTTNANTGLFDVVVTALDQHFNEAATTLHLSVAPTYHIPSVLTTGIPLTLSAGTAWHYSLPPGLFTEDVDLDPLTLAASWHGSALPSWLSFNAATQSFSAQPTDAATGPFDILLTATDLGHNSASTTLHLSVAGVYQAPTVSTTGIPLTLSAWSNWSYSLPPGLFSETVTGDTLTYSAGWQGSALPSWLSFNAATRTFTAMARNAQTGLLDVVVTAADQVGLSAATTLHLSVAPTYHPPSVSTTGIPLTLSAGTAWSYSLPPGLFTEDVDLDPLTLAASWHGSALPSWLSFNAATQSFSAQPTDAATGPFDILLTATDLGHNSAGTTLHLSVAGVYQAPSVSTTGIPLTLSAWSSWSYSLPPGLFSGTVAGDTLTYSAGWQGSALPSWLSFNPGTQTFTAMATNSQTGLLDVVVTAAEHVGLSGATTLHLSVAPTYDPPSVGTPPPAMTLSAGTDWSYSLPVGLFSEAIIDDPLAYSASYQGSALPGWLSFNAATQSFSAQPTDAATGPFDIQLTATDLGHNSASTTLHLAVAGVYHVPVVTTTISSQSAFWGAAWSYSLPPGLFSEDVRGDTLTYSASSNGSALPSWLTIDPTTGALGGTVPNGTGAVPLTVTASDLGGRSASVNFQLNTADPFAPTVIHPMAFYEYPAGVSISTVVDLGTIAPLLIQAPFNESVTYSGALTVYGDNGAIESSTPQNQHTALYVDSNTGDVRALDPFTFSRYWFVYFKIIAKSPQNVTASTNFFFDIANSNVPQKFSYTPPPVSDFNNGQQSAIIASISAHQTSGMSLAAAVTGYAASIPTPPAPSGLAGGDDSGVLGDGVTNVTRPHIVGTGAVAGADVLLYEGASLLGSGTADANGAYAIQPDAPLSDGLHSLSVRQMVNGVASESSALCEIGITAVDVSWDAVHHALVFPDILTSALSLTATGGSQPTNLQIDPTDAHRLLFDWQAPPAGSTVFLDGRVVDASGHQNEFVQKLTF